MSTPKKIAKKIAANPKKQHKQPGIEAAMQPKPLIDEPKFHQSKKLKNKIALITGGDSGIGHSVALFFAHAGADVAIVYLNEHQDAKKTQSEIEKLGRKCLLISGDVKSEKFCIKAVKKTIKHFGKLHILVNNAAVQYPQESLKKISAKQLKQTFETNVFSYFYMTKAALAYLKRGSCIINTASVTAYKGSDHLLDYSATKGAVVAFTRSFSESLVKEGIRVNGVAPGPVWTPLIPATFSKKHIREFGKNVPMGRPAEPEEIAGCYVFLASADSQFMSGQVLHPNGGVIVNS